MNNSLVVLLGLLLASCHPSLQRSSRIIGGEEARVAQFPYAAAIYVTTTTSITFCGGALISNLWVLTAGHCIVGAIQMQVQLGSVSLNEEDPNRIILTTSNMVIHPLYNAETFDNDIGLVMFRTAITLTDYIKPTSFFPIADLPGSAPVTTFGWGQTSDEVAGVSNSLNYVELTTITNEECRLTYGTQISEGMVCVAGNFNEGICRGDSGSPLIQNIGGGHTLIVGIASFMSENGCETTEPSGYTRVFPHKEWISAVTSITL